MSRSPEMQKLLDQFSKNVLGRSHSEAVAQAVCVFCGRTPKFVDWTELDFREWEISRVCKSCWEGMIATLPEE